MTPQQKSTLAIIGGIILGAALALAPSGDDIPAPGSSYNLQYDDPVYGNYDYTP